MPISGWQAVQFVTCENCATAECLAVMIGRVTDHALKIVHTLLPANAIQWLLHAAPAFLSDSIVMIS